MLCYVARGLARTEQELFSFATDQYQSQVYLEQKKKMTETRKTITETVLS